jgi:hypothetical protein
LRVRLRRMFIRQVPAAMAYSSGASP